MKGADSAVEWRSWLANTRRHPPSEEVRSGKQKASDAGLKDVRHVCQQEIERLEAHRRMVKLRAKGDNSTAILLFRQAGREED